MISSLILITLGKQVSIGQVEQVFKSNLSVNRFVFSRHLLLSTLTTPTTPRKRRTRKTTPAKPKVEVIKVEPKTTSPDLSKLSGIDFVILPLIYLEAFVVNFLMNCGLKVPDRVAVK